MRLINSSARAPARRMVRRAFVRVAVAGAVALGVASCTGSSAPGGNGALRVLFIGNSLTYTNVLPAMVQALATASGISLVTDEAAEPAFALEDHWTIGSARSKVRDGNFDIVIMQQGPSSLPESRVLLRDWTVTWAAEIRARGGQPGLYAVWPDATRMFAFADVSESYRLAADDVNGYFFPVGDTWLDTWARDADAPLYGPDDFHPSSAGTYAAAVVIVAILSERDPTTLSTATDLPGVFDGTLTTELAATIRAAASAVIASYGAQVRPQ